MATLIGDVFTDSSRFHNIVSGPGLQHQHAYTAQGDDPHFRNRSTSRSRARDAPASHTPTNSTPASRYSGRGDRESAQKPAETDSQPSSSHGGASRFPSPPSSTSSEASSAAPRPQHGADSTYMASSVAETSGSAHLASSAASTSTASSTSTATTVIPAPSTSHQIPSPASDSGPRWNNSLSDLTAQSSVVPSPSVGSPTQTQTTIRIRDLAHIQSLARSDLLANNTSGILNDPPLQAMKYEISGMPINDIIEMVAALLTKITTTNDLQHDALNRNAAHIRQAQAAASRSEEGSDNNAEHMSPLSSSVLAFHGKNVPAITILSYLSRIHKYCPTTYEVFLSLLVYFDRMTERVNAMVLKAEEERRQQLAEVPIPRPEEQMPADPDTVMRDDSGDSDETDSDLADDDDEEVDEDRPSRPVRAGTGGAATGASVRPHSSTPLPIPAATYFVVDSFNIHRLIIAGVTCASKFFSDVFYTNSRYAKVGGLPLAELNHLELQFLLLNDFRLAVPVEDLEAYATMLVEFYAREVVAQRSRPVVGGE
ncbi:cyclin-domain-containing protein [Coniochaeta ligniaria NRRL 30616]|uniref:Cyclin-domain-containing protein n=1 Tax=Coniochaeta ligniaria NRRL 30616 TaxID=1408157 RepID=A0A1J7JXT5_9PEZI|nr:cyclin-domain-containing protein [Coniochaeta ligniaria NRRL 30616]